MCRMANVAPCAWPFSTTRAAVNGGACSSRIGSADESAAGSSGGRGRGGAGDGAKGVPHWKQKRATAGFTVRQLAHAFPVRARAAGGSAASAASSCESASAESSSEMEPAGPVAPVDSSEPQSVQRARLPQKSSFSLPHAGQMDMRAGEYGRCNRWVNQRTTEGESRGGTVRRTGLLAFAGAAATRYARRRILQMIRLNDILEKVNAYHPDADLDLVKKAYVYSAKVHQGQMRKSGEPYLVHPLEVAGLLADLKLDEASIVAGLLHDTIEDTLATPEEIKELFGAEVLDLVDGVTKLGKFQSSQAISARRSRRRTSARCSVAMAKDIRVILVKLADRTAQHADARAHEAREAAAHRAGDAGHLRAARQPARHPAGSRSSSRIWPSATSSPPSTTSSRRSSSRAKKDRERFIADVVELFAQQAQGARPRGAGRRAGPSTSTRIYKKMRKNGHSTFDAALRHRRLPRHRSRRCPQCYEALGLIHSLWKPVPGRFKDYIAMPKPNMYQSLHTTVIGPTGERIEIQIRTEEMHRIAEEGIAAHWEYKEGKGASAARTSRSSPGCAS